MNSSETEPLVLGLESHNMSSSAIEEFLGKRHVTIQWWPRLIVRESRLIWLLSWATIANTILTYMLSFVTLVFVGHLGVLELAGASLASLGLQGLAYGVMVGMGTAAQTASGQAYGAKRYEIMGIICQRSIIIQLGAAILLTPLYWYSGPFLKFVGHWENGTISDKGQIFARGLIPQLYAYALCYPMQSFLLAQKKVNPLACISLGVFLLHVPLTWLVVDILDYGLLGAALTLSLSWCIFVFSIGLYIILSPSCSETWRGFSLKVFRLKGFWHYFKFTIVAAVMLCLEAWYSIALVLMSERLPKPTISVDSISICMNYWNWDCNLNLGILLAASVRVSNELGAGHPNVAKMSMAVISGISILVSLFLCLFVLIFRVGLSKLYSTDSQVIEVVSTLIPLLIISIFINGTHFTLSGVAIGSGRQGLVAFINLVSYYFIGLPITYILGFKTSLGVAGLYWGLIIGISIEITAVIVVLVRTNWDAEVEKAADRLKKSGDEESFLDVIL